MNRRVCAGVLIAALVFPACSRKKEASDAGAPAASDTASAAASAAPSAANASDVARFGDEEALDGGSVSLVAAATVHAQPGAGAVVASLAKGTEVNTLAEHGTSTLVTFADPKNGSSTLMGWVASAAVGKGELPKLTPTPGPAIACPAGKIAVFNNKCAAPCKTVKDCPGVGRSCTEVPTAGGGRNVSVCLPP